MFVTLQKFFDDYRIKNQQQPNETVLNRGLMRLKRETRELKSIIDILTGTALPTYDANKIYEEDEYISHNELIYRSLGDVNYGNTPPFEGDSNWELITLDSVANSKGTTIKYQSYTATDGQTEFITNFNLEGMPLVFIDGMLVEDSAYEATTNTKLTLYQATAENETVTILAGITYASKLILAKQRFTATSSQYIFNTSFVLASPSVFVDGVLRDEGDGTNGYTWANHLLENCV